jgi:hypothetical protein
MRCNQEAAAVTTGSWYALMRAPVGRASVGVPANDEQRQDFCTINRAYVVDLCMYVL